MSLYVIDERRYYVELNDARAHGVARGIQDAAEHVLSRAAAAFAAGKDDEARWLRDVAIDLRNLAAARRPPPCFEVSALPLADIDNPDEMAALRAASEEFV